MQRLVCKGALARRDSIVVDAVGTAVSAAEGAQINHPAPRRPRERMPLSITGRRAGTDNLSLGVHRCEPAFRTRERFTDEAGGAAEGAEINHSARRRPPENMKRGVASRVTTADNLTARVDNQS